MTSNKENAVIFWTLKAKDNTKDDNTLVSGFLWYFIENKSDFLGTLDTENNDFSGALSKESNVILPDLRKQSFAKAPNKGNIEQKVQFSWNVNFIYCKA